MGPVSFYPIYDFENGRKLGELKHDRLRKFNQWTALLENPGTYGGVEFFHRLGDYPTAHQAEKALRAEDQEKLKALGVLDATWEDV